jgi:hypothetical protein
MGRDRHPERAGADAVEVTCRACDEARRAAYAFLDRMATAVRLTGTRPQAVPRDPDRYHDRPWQTGRRPATVRRPAGCPPRDGSP